VKVLNNMLEENVLVIALKDDIDEALALVKTLGYSKVHYYILKRKGTDKNFYLGRGKLEELRDIIASEGISRVYIYDELKPRQVVNLTRELKIRVSDRIEVILEIFALHAGSKEAKLQIELAKLMHELPLIREWVRRVKLGELPGFLGPGGYATDSYYYSVRRRYARIKKELNELRERRRLERMKRASYGYPQVAIAGYTNAGKTTLFNTLTKESKPVGNELFTTLSPKVKGTWINGRKIIFVDTVGFVRNVPAEVIEAFYATLEEIAESSLTVLLLDSLEPTNIILSKLTASLNLLNRIGYLGKPLIVALNKIDELSDELHSKVALTRDFLSVNYRWRWEVIPISALKGLNLDVLKNLIIDMLEGF